MALIKTPPLPRLLPDEAKPVCCLKLKWNRFQKLDYVVSVWIAIWHKYSPELLVQTFREIRKHSSSMRTAFFHISDSRGGLPYRDPPGQRPRIQSPPLGQRPYPLDRVPSGRNMEPGSQTGKWHHTENPPPPHDRMTDTHFWKYFLAQNFVCGR